MSRKRLTFARVSKMCPVAKTRQDGCRISTMQLNFYIKPSFSISIILTMVEMPSQRLRSQIHLEAFVETVRNEPGIPLKVEQAFVVRLSHVENETNCRMTVGNKT